MLDQTELAKRLDWCFAIYQTLRDRNVTLEEFGQVVAKGERRQSPYSASTVRAWFRAAGSVPSGDAVLVIAKLVRVDPGWLMFGEQSKAPMPDLWDRRTVPIRLRATRDRMRHSA